MDPHEPGQAQRKQQQGRGPSERGSGSELRSDAGNEDNILQCEIPSLKQMDGEDGINEREKEEEVREEAPEEEWFGINKNLYRYPTTKPDFIVKTGTDEALLPQSPEFVDFKEDMFPMYEPKPFMLEEAIKRDIQIICFMSTLMKKIVYDVNGDQPVPSKDVNPKDHGVDVLPYYIPTSGQDTTLVFQARFQTGNLRRAIQLVEFEYQLILKNDYGTQGHTQWFYFSVSNVRKDVEYKFTIINLMKPDSLYNSGMRPLFYSNKLAQLKKTSWYRDGYDICYYQNNLKRKNGDFFYSLNFSVKFPYDCDTVYIAHCYPYTYSRLQNFLRELELCPKRKQLVQRKTLCQTVAGNNCDYVIISDFNNGKEKKGVFLTSRVHPGESMASHIIQFIIEFLTGSSAIAKVLRENFLFKIVPMLNIDGVIIGNYRCNLSMVDLNRQWIDPSKKLHPTIYYTKQMIKRMKEERELLIYCDFHGHSRKKNCFMYGCGKDNSKKEQVFPALVRTNCNTFAFKDCCFLIQKDREGASRIAIWKELNIVNCYTLEVSFCGPDAGKHEYRHFNQEHYRAMAEGFCLSIYDLYEPDQAKVKQVTSDLEQNLLRYEKFAEDDSDGDDSDFSNEDKTKTVGGSELPLKNEKDPAGSKNQIVIKKKVNSKVLPDKKKK